MLGRFSVAAEPASIIEVWYVLAPTVTAMACGPCAWFWIISITGEPAGACIVAGVMLNSFNVTMTCVVRASVADVDRGAQAAVTRASIAATAKMPKALRIRGSFGRASISDPSREPVSVG